MQEPLAHLIERTFSAAECGVIYRVIRSHRHVRRFAANPIPMETLWRILDAAVCVPSVRGKPPWQVILITSSTRRGMLTGAVEALYADDASRPSNRPGQGVAGSGTRERMRPAPRHPVVTYDRSSGSPVGSALALEWTMDLYHLGIAIQHLWLAACAEGVGIEWVRLADRGPVARLLDLPWGGHDGPLMRATKRLPSSPCIRHYRRGILSGLWKWGSRVAGAGFRDRPADGQREPTPGASRANWRRAAHRRSPDYHGILCVAIWLVIWHGHRTISALSLCAKDHTRQCLLQIS